MKQDTVKLIKECDAGVKTAVNSIDEVLDDIKSEDLRRIMNDSRRKHEELGDDIHSSLNSLSESGKDPNPMARAMSWMKINWKLAEKPSDSTVANLMYDGCSMGVKSLAKYLNDCTSADESSKGYAKKLIEIEDTLMSDLRTFM